MRGLTIRSGIGLLAMLALFPVTALAQTAPQPPEGRARAQTYQQQPDPRLAGPTIAALQSLLALREAELKALGEDAVRKLHEAEAADQAHQATWAQWFEAAKPAAKPEDAPPK